MSVRIRRASQSGPWYERWHNGVRETRNRQCPAILKTRPGFRCDNRARYPIDPSRPDGLWLVCGVHR